ncbi:HD-GYP domain, c-di-GMP phosphodiesterase class II (or its inactivated variant) [Peptoclostridium litorale DSM 5388]|uniref:Metal dependent phosphohydrolase n=1 Tax=Peptoclostridium litorale DSM 5388 TaxID=1121324 RepID=A0A069RG20_PEPLI|nr:HD domain-containing phosphohydrolase [Peptoclostridium litorale]KDR95971.1 metal dependent phosphohydrolase [Peptoclostridium litorale DSM 5388]SIO08941.1 HD-GYP domain, c-di-GMP phosphodiesterase class II (or its inactivated variant) [Peptoclostridium litorale DSM 5388]
MKLAVLSEKCEGKVLAKPVYNRHGQIVLNTGRPISKYSVQKLLELGINSVYVEELGTEDIVVEDLIEMRKRIEVLNEMESIFSQAASKKYFSEEKIRGLIREIIMGMSISEKSVLDANSIRNIENTICVHSLNVAILSTLVGIHIGYNFEKLCELALGALFHDIGKAVADGEDHTEKGFEVLRGINSIKAITAIGALQHHEHCDGGGYPKKAQSKDIHEFSKIIAICNEYDNLASMQGIKPSEAVERIVAQTPSRFDEKIIKIFKENTYIYPTGTEVRLSNGKRGIVCNQNKNMPSRPIVKTKEGHCNLMEELTIFIEAA